MFFTWYVCDINSLLTLSPIDRITRLEQLPSLTPDQCTILIESLLITGQVERTLPYLPLLMQGNSPASYYLVGIIKRYLGSIDEAVNFLQKAVDIPDTYVELGFLSLFNRNDPETAIGYFSQLSDLSLSLTCHGITEYWLGNSENALMFIEEARRDIDISLLPPLNSVYFCLILCELGNCELATEILTMTNHILQDVTDPFVNVLHTLVLAELSQNHLLTSVELTEELLLNRAVKISDKCSDPVAKIIALDRRRLFFQRAQRENLALSDKKLALKIAKEKNVIFFINRLNS